VDFITSGRQPSEEDFMRISEWIKKQKKLKNINQEKVDTIQKVRVVRENLSSDIKDMTPAQLKKYIESKKTLHPAKAWKKQTAKAK
jgi:hypothetical protein